MSEINYRRHDIDWIRVIAIGLLLIYHITLSFQPWGIIFLFIPNKESIEMLWIPMSLLNLW
ncbi:MAG: acyltransferase, partial [Psychroflexus sp.]